ncbi:MAG: hypothetical protein DWI48_01510 [Chloroflexi bacterium]|nr:MAG: hypothetical protein DWI48_01510 [Chloroflexota bacterium]
MVALPGARDLVLVGAGDEMRAILELNGYAEIGEGQQPLFRPIPDEIRVLKLPTTIVLRAIWRAEPGDDDPPGYLPVARILLDHTEPNHRSELGQLPELFREPLERWDGASVIFAAYTLHVNSLGDHVLAFPKAGLPEQMIRIRLGSAVWGRVDG